MKCVWCVRADAGQLEYSMKKVLRVLKAWQAEGTTIGATQISSLLVHSAASPSLTARRVCGRGNMEIQDLAANDELESTRLVDGLVDDALGTIDMLTMRVLCACVCSCG